MTFTVSPRVRRIAAHTPGELPFEEYFRQIFWASGVDLPEDLGPVFEEVTLEAVDGGTLVTSYYDWSDIHEQWREAGIFPILPESALRATLGILDRTVARGYPRAAT